MQLLAKGTLSPISFLIKFYYRTAERFDPREHSWTEITSMSTRRGCHTLAVLDGKLYVFNFRAF